MKKFACTLMIYTTITTSVFSSGVGVVTGYDIPRLVSSKSIPVNVRTGPGRRYPVKWVYRIRLPLQIIDEHGDWRKVRDWQGEDGWVHRLLLSSKRLGIITQPLASLHSNSDLGASLEAKLRRNVVIQLDYCKIDWCKINVPLTNYSGYVKTHTFWGLDTNEIIE